MIALRYFQLLTLHVLVTQKNFMLVPKFLGCMLEVSFDKPLVVCWKLSFDKPLEITWQLCLHWKCTYALILFLCLMFYNNIEGNPDFEFKVNGKIRPQAARFRNYGYKDDVNLGEIDLSKFNDWVEIKWTVVLANIHRYQRAQWKRHTSKCRYVVLVFKVQ